MVFGLSTTGPVQLTETTSTLQTTPDLGPAEDQGVVGQFVMDEDDPELPEAVAQAPSVRPGSEQDAVQVATQAAEQSATTAEQPQPAEQTVAAEPGEAVVEQGSTDQDQPEVATAQEEPQPQPVAFAPAEQPKKRGFLASLFGNQAKQAAPASQQPARPLVAAAPEEVPSPETTAEAEPAKPLIQLASTEAAARPLVASAASDGNGALPGVRQNALFEITRRSGLDDDSDIDLHEGDGGSYQVASAAGLARLAPNGLLKQTESVDVACLKPSLVRVLRAIENHYGNKVVVTSGYRNPERNRRARGARKSLHMYCAAADVQVAGVSKWDLAQFVRTMPGRGGVGTYCHTNSVHIDVGPERDWNWRCRRRK